jgi:hypothetical protein
MEHFHYLAQFVLDPLPQPGGTEGGSRIVTVINVALVTAGSVAVLIIVLSGIRYIISRGDPQSITKAKNSILYAVIGLVICMSAGAIVNFVLRRL